jgi:hypothetical protein
MPIPANDSTWPPAPWDKAQKAWREHETLWIGDAEQIAAFYGGGRVAATHEHDGQPRSGGLVGWLSTRFWGQAVPEGEVRTREHVGWASDLTTLSSDLLFAEPPRVAFDDELKVSEDAQKRLDLIANSDEAHAAQHEGGELTSLFGASALTVRWDTETTDHAWVAPSGADLVIPEFRNGRLTALTLFTEYPEGGEVWRHLERHEKGRILHLLFKGDKQNIGKRRNLADYPATQYLLDIVKERDPATEADFFRTNTQQLTASWWLNAPARAWRRDGDLAEAGRSDLTPTVRQLGDSLDEIYSSWLKDIRLGAARLLIPESYLESDSSGGFAFDRGQELIRKINAPGLMSSSVGDSIEKIQFEIRTEDHERSALAWWKRMLGTAGYGELDAETQGVQKTATESGYEQDSKQRTRDKKALYARPALSSIYGACMAIDGQLFRGKGGGEYEAPEVRFPEQSQMDPLKEAQVISTLKAAGVMSVEIGVKAAHRDWDQNAVDEEVARLRKAGAVDPTKLGATNPSNAEEAAARARLGIDTQQPAGGAGNAAAAAAIAATEARKGATA